MLTVSHNGNPIINIIYSLRQNTQKAWIMFWIQMLTWQNEQVLQHSLSVSYTIYAYCSSIDETKSKWTIAKINHQCAMQIKFHDHC